MHVISTLEYRTYANAAFTLLFPNVQECTYVSVCPKIYTFENMISVSDIFCSNLTLVYRNNQNIDILKICCRIIVLCCLKLMGPENRRSRT